MSSRTREQKMYGIQTSIRMSIGKTGQSPSEMAFDKCIAQAKADMDNGNYEDALYFLEYALSQKSGG